MVWLRVKEGKANVQVQSVAATIWAQPLGVEVKVTGVVKQGSINSTENDLKVETGVDCPLTFPFI